MNTSFNFLFFISTFLIISIQPFLSAQPTCPSLMPYACSTTGPEIKFPFWLKASYDLCTYPGFEVSCNNKSQTIINLPTSGDFIVKRIDYLNKAIYINDETSCLPNRMRNFTLSDTPFKPSNLRRYKFVNCSSNWTDDLGSNIYHPFTISCLSGKNHSVYAVSSRIPNQELPSYCYEIDTNSSQWFVSRYWLPMVMVGELRLVWSDPRCYSCAAQRLTCRVSDNDEVVCVSPSRNGIPRTAKYGIIVGVGIPAFLLILAIMGYTCGRIKAQDIRRRLDNELSDTITLQPVITITGGLDGRTIESYPKTELGESGRLPKPNDVTCPICLCEYQPKETLRSIPECNHYFHVNCIDEWLKLNGTCPLCRNSPESLSSFPIASSISTTTS